MNDPRFNVVENSHQMGPAIPSETINELIERLSKLPPSNEFTTTTSDNTARSEYQFDTHSERYIKKEGI